MQRARRPSINAPQSLDGLDEGRDLDGGWIGNTEPAVPFDLPLTAHFNLSLPPDIPLDIPLDISLDIFSDLPSDLDVTNSLGNVASSQATLLSYNTAPVANDWSARDIYQYSETVFPERPSLETRSALVQGSKSLRAPLPSGTRCIRCAVFKKKVIKPS